MYNDSNTLMWKIETKSFLKKLSFYSDVLKKVRKPCGFFIYQKDIANVDIIMIYCYQKATSYNWGCSVQLCSGWSESLCWGFFANKYAGCHNQQKINWKRNKFGMSHSRMGAILAFAILSLCLWSGWVHGKKSYRKVAISEMVFVSSDLFCSCTGKCKIA